MNFPVELEQRLVERRSEGLYRTLLPGPQAAVPSFCSNDYLGFAMDPELGHRFLRALEEFPLLGSGGSRLLSGNQDCHEEAEQTLARFSAQEAALLFPSGYQANIALLSALLNPDSLVFSDQLNHASIIDGIRLSGARKIIYPHLDLEALESQLRAHRRQSGFKLIVSESVFSMEGDRAPLEEILGLADRYGTHVVVDEAHATGIHGAGLAIQRGLQDRILASVHTGGKALGCAGAWVAGSNALKECLVNGARPFIYSTAPLPALALLLKTSVRYWKDVGPARCEKLFALSQHARVVLSRALVVPAHATGPILPLILGSAARATALSESLEQRGMRIPAIRPPTVPSGTARLRITVSTRQSPADLDGLAHAIEESLGGLAP